MVAACNEHADEVWTDDLRAVKTENRTARQAKACHRRLVHLTPEFFKLVGIY
jgi:hypothetical protein